MKTEMNKEGESKEFLLAKNAELRRELAIRDVTIVEYKEELRRATNIIAFKNERIRQLESGGTEVKESVEATSQVFEGLQIASVHKKEKSIERVEKETEVVPQIEETSKSKKKNKKNKKKNLQAVNEVAPSAPSESKSDEKTADYPPDLTKFRECLMGLDRYGAYEYDDLSLDETMYKKELQFGEQLMTAGCMKESAERIANVLFIKGALAWGHELMSMVQKHLPPAYFALVSEKLPSAERRVKEMKAEIILEIKKAMAFH